MSVDVAVCMLKQELTSVLLLLVGAVCVCVGVCTVCAVAGDVLISLSCL